MTIWKRLVLGFFLFGVVAQLWKANADGDLDAKASSGLIELSGDDISRYVLSRNQDYHVFFLYNFNCEPCLAFQSEFAVYADSWRRALSKGQDLPKVYFAFAMFNNNRERYQRMNIKGPVLVHYGPTYSKPHPSKRLPSKQHLFAGEPSAEGVAAFVREKTGAEVEVYRSPWMALAFLAVFLGLFGTVAYIAREQIIRLVFWARSQQFIWFLAAVGVYFIAVSGFLYDIIRGVPLYGYDPASGRSILVSNQGNHQFMMEGFIVGFMNCVCGGIIILLAVVLPRWKSANRDPVVVLAVVLFGALYWQIIKWYKIKSPWYMVV